MPVRPGTRSPEPGGRASDGAHGRLGLLAVAIAGCPMFIAGCPIPEPDLPPAPPDIRRFEVVPFLVEPGGEAEVRWRVAGAVDVLDLVLPGGEAAALGSLEGRRALRPGMDAALELVARGPGGTTRARATVRVGRPVPVAIDAFAVTPTRSRAGEPVRVTWAARAASRIALEVGAAEVEDDLPEAGARIVRPARTTSIRLRAEGLGGPLIRSARVEVGAPPPFVARFRVVPPEIEVGGTASLRWEVEEVDRLVLRSQGPDEPPRLLRVIDAPEPQGSEQLAPSAGVWTYHLEAEGPGGLRRTSATLLVVEPARPAIDRFTVTPTVTGPGGEARLAWAVRGAETVTLDITDGEPTSVPAVGSRRIQAGERPIRAELLGVGGGRTAAQEVTLEVDARRPRIVAFGSSPARVALGEAVAVRWEVEGADHVRVRDELDTTRLDDLPLAGVGNLRPEGPIRIILDARNADGVTERSQVLLVGPRPRVDRFAILDSVFRLGRPIRLTWTVENARRRLLLTPGGTPTLTEADTGTAALRRLDLRLGEPDARLEASTDLFAVTVTTSAPRLGAARGGLEEEPNDGPATAHELALPPVRVEGTLRPGERDAIAVEGVAPSRLQVTVGCSGTGLALVAAPLDDEGAPMARAVRLDPLICGRIVEAEIAHLPPDLLLTLEPDRFGGPEVELPWALDFDRALPRCGDGVVDRDEACDDGNRDRFDGCDDDCLIEGLDEVEPNDALAAASPLAAGTTDAFLVGGEQDWFAFSLPGAGPTGAWRFLVEDRGGGCSVDLRLALFDGAGRLVEEVGADGLGCPSLSGPRAVLGPGTWSLRLRSGEGRRLPVRGAYRLTAIPPP